MIIESIELHNFRNYRRLNLEVGPSVNIIYGFNAQGKTNLIEAINVCSCLSSHRTAKDRELISFDEDEYEIRMSLFDPPDNYRTEVYVGFFTEKSSVVNTSAPRRVLKQDSIKIDRIAGYLGICNTVIFAPEDLNLIKGFPSVRRKFLNLTISKVSPTYVDLLSKYSRLIEQKNASLKNCKIDKIDDTVLDFWDYPLADISSDIILYRYRYCLLLNTYARIHHLDISDEKETLEISYSTITGAIDVISKFLNENEYYDAFIAGNVPEAIYTRIKGILSEYLYSRFKATRQNDCERGKTGIGIHRDDFDITLNGLLMKSFSSQGQQRSAALSLKLSELDILRNACKTAPILLLDDVFSELDVNRRVSLLSGVVDAQVFITCTEREYIEKEIMNLIVERDNVKLLNVDSVADERTDMDKESIDVRFFHVDGGNIVAE